MTLANALLTGFGARRLAIALALALAGVVLTSDVFPTWGRAATVFLFAAYGIASWMTADRSFLTSPPFLLGLIAAVFYSLIPGSYDTIVYPGIRSFGTYLATEAERLILVFALAAFATQVMVASWRKCGDDTPVQSPAWWKNHLVVGAAIGFGIMVLTVNASNLLPGMRHIAVPIGVFIVIFVTRALVVEDWRGVAATIAYTALTGGMFLFAGEGKTVVVLFAAALAYGLRLRRVSLRHSALTCLAVGVVLVVTIQVFQVVRNPSISLVAEVGPEEQTLSASERLLKRFKGVLHLKIILRQFETGDCFDTVLSQHASESFALGRQGYWLAILVPRALWPEKPDFSLGQYYAKRYCGMAHPEVNSHSASITLLGQPLIHGGMAGLVLHGGLLLCALGFLARAGKDPESSGAVLSVALLPWLVDFDQDFALYVGNAVKFGLLMIILTLGLALMGKALRNHSRPRNHPEVR